MVIYFRSMGGISLRMHLLLAAVLVTAFSLDIAKGARILFVSIQQKSHALEMKILGEELVSRGHEVFIILHDRFPGQAAFKEAGFEVLNFQLKPFGRVTITDKAMESEMSRWIFDQEVHDKFPVIAANVAEDCKDMQEDQNLWNKLQSLDIDFAMVDGIFFGPCSFLVPHRLGIPYGYMFSAGAQGWALRTPNLPSFVPNGVPLFKHSRKAMNLVERLLNLFVYVFLALELPPLRIDTDLLEIYAPDKTQWSDLVLGAELFINTRDHLLEPPQPSMPHVIFTPGITSKPAQSLPQNLEGFVTQSTLGSVVVSFGSSVSEAPVKVLAKFVEAFRRLSDYHFIWRINEHLLAGIEIPSNVLTTSWMPQNDVLGHANVVLFITHCGNNGQYESVYHGVPMIGFPLMAEQNVNANRLKHYGIGIAMDIFDFTPEDLVSNIKVVTETKSYRQNVEKLSSIYKDRPITPLEEISHWMEHVIKYGGAHLRSTAVDMPLYQFLCLDLLACVLLFVLVFLALLLLASKRVYRTLFGNSRKEKLQ